MSVVNNTLNNFHELFTVKDYIYHGCALPGKYSIFMVMVSLLESTNTAPSSLRYDISIKCTVITYHLA